MRPWGPPFLCLALTMPRPPSLPLAFYLKLFSKEIGRRERILAYTIMTVSILLSAVGTVWAFLPKSLIGAE